LLRTRRLSPQRNAEQEADKPTSQHRNSPSQARPRPMWTCELADLNQCSGVVQVRARGGRKTPLQAPDAGASTGESTRMSTLAVALDLAGRGRTAIAAPRQQPQSGQFSGQPSL